MELASLEDVREAMEERGFDLDTLFGLPTHHHPSVEPATGREFIRAVLRDGLADLFIAWDEADDEYAQIECDAGTGWYSETLNMLAFQCYAVEEAYERVVHHAVRVRKYAALVREAQRNEQASV